MGTDGKDVRMGGHQTTGLGVFFKVVVQEVLIFGSETWVIAPRMGRDLGSFQHRFARYIIGR